MGALANDPGVYVRSLATRGALGGLSRAAQDACDVLDAAGYDPVVVETAGVGQSEVAVAGAADTVVVVVAPGSGDGVQALKGGLFEAADLVVVNQGDRDGAQALASEIAAAVELRTTGAKPKVMVTVATDGTGVAELHAAIDSHGKELAAGAGLSSRRAARARARVREAVESRLVASFWNGKTDALDRAAADVAAGKATVAQAAAAIAGGGGVR
jgi:LAO/AO transport system kinase